MRLLLIIIFIISVQLPLYKNGLLYGSTTEDVIYLKNGSVIYGEIMEIIPNEHVKVKILGGSILVYRFYEIKKIEKQLQSEASENPYKKHKNFGMWGLLGSWGLTVLGSAAMGDESVGTTVIPIVGPFITMARVEGENGTYLPGGKSLLTISGVTQSAFLVYTVYSAFAESSFKSSKDYTILPHYDDIGVSVVVRF